MDSAPDCAHESPGPRFRAINARFERLYQ